MSRIFVVLAAVITIVPALFICCAPAPEVLINEFYAAPAPLAQGESSTLHWNVSGAAEVSIDNGIGVVPLSGSWQVRPATSTTYLLTATNRSKSAEKPLLLEVQQKPSVQVQQIQIPIIPAQDTKALLSNAGKEAIVDGVPTYISSWMPSRFSGSDSGPWTFMFFMTDVLEGSANNSGMGEYCPECWRDYTSHFRVIIRPDYLTAVLPALSKAYNGNFIINSQGLIVGATAEGKIFIIPSPYLSAGYMITNPVNIRIRGVITNYLSAPAVYVTSPDQISSAGR